jgi:hypothetical protein|tara:strand:+ start:638 stop:820 length:183 start_codon:yes stop_codon:yes gene_type:complete
MEANVIATESQGGPIEPERRKRLLADAPQALIAVQSSPVGTMAHALPSMTIETNVEEVAA